MLCLQWLGWNFKGPRLRGLRISFYYFFAGAQGYGRLGDSFLWEGSLFVFQYVGGDGRGHILAQGPQLKISSFGKEKEELKK